MRVIAGTARGVPLVAPRDRAHATDHRPRQGDPLRHPRRSGASTHESSTSTPAAARSGSRRCRAAPPARLRRARPPARVEAIRENLERTGAAPSMHRSTRCDVCASWQRRRGRRSGPRLRWIRRTRSVLSSRRSSALVTAPGARRDGRDQALLAHADSRAVEGLARCAERRFGETTLTFWLTRADGVEDMSRVAVFPGSFDPMTNAHLDVARRARGALRSARHRRPQQPARSRRCSASTSGRP